MSSFISWIREEDYNGDGWGGIRRKSKSFSRLQ
jgi:hypothetical protein